jgi:hypothetical protein
MTMVSAEKEGERACRTFQWTRRHSLPESNASLLQQWTLRPARGTCSKLIVAFPTGGDDVMQEDNMARENNTAFQTSDSCDPIDTSTPELI